ncbi:DegT/DnrJ/EryC1/StrS family aminotransferase [Cyanobacterium sp. DS4]|uniref:DegT/DnrJ/EryC1/StrS family aminotransferase n=1 Tax=Cyanobacterium sp. DS4 TaxID=2878255 RepID=UPI002E818477|nr:DegT/DnrJ/EryC1/StrS family aminotransferase [Cyanobacterium sp. Dongsha4]WVL02270.1 DegT/DnrJ/EryC1/StrS family aminotransferase [Cyanobacterium sp. Dongsha4]
MDFTSICLTKTQVNLAKHITNTAKIPHKWEFNHDQIGYNYRLPNLNAALGVAQLEQLPKFLEKKRQLADKYRQVFQNIEGISFFSEREYAKSNYWLNVLLLDTNYIHERNDLLQLLNDNGIMTRPVWTLMNKLPMFKNSPKMDLTQAEKIVSCLINIPSSVFL